ncbi:MAG: HAD-IIIA family hydrolase [Phycisphaeraceae bacterium]
MSLNPRSSVPKPQATTPDPDVIRLLVLDVDGVLTDGSIVLDEHGHETKRFHVRDGLGIKLLRDNGVDVAVLSARASRAVSLRMKELKVTLVSQGNADKEAGLARLLEQAGVSADHAAYMGDDLQDLPAMQRCAYRISVPDAPREVRDVAHHVTFVPGGRGAVRDAAEHLLRTQGKWRQAIAEYTGGRSHR